MISPEKKIVLVLIYFEAFLTNSELLLKICWKLSAEMWMVMAHWKRLETEFINMCINKTKIMVSIYRTVNSQTSIGWRYNGLVIDYVFIRIKMVRKVGIHQQKGKNGFTELFIIRGLVLSTCCLSKIREL